MYKLFIAGEEILLNTEISIMYSWEEYLSLEQNQIQGSVPRKMCNATDN